MLRVVAMLCLVLVVAVASLLGGIYLYLKPADPLPIIAVHSSVRTIDTGEIIGFQSANNAHGWLGIPYAQPPVAELRWRSPKPALGFVGRREALTYGEPCLQRMTLPDDSGETSFGSEDCLYLNLWAPAVSPNRVPVDADRLPVMLWIHGGGNTVGSAGHDNLAFYDGSLMAGEQNVVVVSVNYRLGPMGWFYHESLASGGATPEDASGNYGTLDLIAALRWIRTNIERFGGDPGNVTIYGESAGGTNVLSLMASPLAEGLFHRGIVQSGGLDLVSTAQAQQIATDSQGNSTQGSREMIVRWLQLAGRAADRPAAIRLLDAMAPTELTNWLREQPADQLLDAYEGGFAGMIEMPRLIADGYVLPELPAEQLFADPQRYNQVPVIMGSTRDESALFMGFSPEYVDLRGAMPVGIKDVAAYRRDVAYASDMYRATNVDNLASVMSTHSPDQVFVYRFDADDWRNYGFIDLKELFGAAHMFDIFFMFGYFPNPLKVVFPDSTFDAVQLLSGAMMSYWAQFAATGDPGQGRNGEEPLWAPWRHISSVTNNDPASESHQAPKGSEGHLNILDTEIDGGIRMTRSLIHADQLISGFLADESYQTLEERCRGYRAVFWSNFDAAKYRALGCQ